MKAARSPRFQSDAERCNIAAISCGGSPSGIFGAEQAAAIESNTTHDARRTVFFSLTWPRERLLETLPRSSLPVVLAAAFLLPGLLLLRLLRRLLPGLRPRLLGGFLFLLGLRLGRGARVRLFHRHRWAGRWRGCRGEHRLHETRPGPTALRHIHLLKHRISPMLIRCGGGVGGL